MNKQILVGAALSLAVFTQSVGSVLAITPGQMPPAAQRRQEVGQARMQEKVTSVVARIAGRVEERFNNHEARLQDWIDRASSRMTEMEAKGKDMSNAKKALDTAKTSLNAASQLGDEAVAKLKVVTAENWTGQKSDAQAAREAVRKAQVAYAQVVKDVQLVLKEMKNAQ